MSDEFGEGELFDRYGARRLQLHMAVGQLIANSADQIAEKVVDRIITEGLDPVTIELTDEMVVRFCTELFVWHAAQHPLEPPIIIYADEDETEEEEEYEEDEPPRRISFWEFIKSWYPRQNI